MQILTEVMRRVLAVPLVASNSTGVTAQVSSWGQTFSNDLSAVLYSVDNAAIDAGKAISITLFIIGVYFWYSRVDRRLGKELVTGGVAIMAFVFIVIPLLLSIVWPTINLP